MLEAMNGVEQILAHLSGCQRAFVLPPCPAEWPATNSLRLADSPRMSTLLYIQNLVFHTLPQPPRYPLQSTYHALLSAFSPVGRWALVRAPAGRPAIFGGPTFMSDICDIQKGFSAPPQPFRRPRPGRWRIPGNANPTIKGRVARGGWRNHFAKTSWGTFPFGFDLPAAGGKGWTTPPL